jgi:hypothetical protein
VRDSSPEGASHATQRRCVHRLARHWPFACTKTADPPDHSSTLKGRLAQNKSGGRGPAGGTKLNPC